MSMSTDLDRRIRQAEQDAATLRGLQESAAELPELQAQRAQQEQQRQAAAALEWATAQAGRERAAYIERAAAFAPKFAQAVKLIEELAEELAEMQRPVFTVAPQLAGTVYQAQRAGLPTAHPAKAWADAGWCDVPDVLPSSPGNIGHVPPTAERLAAILTWKAGGRVYMRGKGIRGAGVAA